MTILPRLLSLGAASALLVACATAAPVQLVQARDAYKASSVGLAATMAPTELYDAKKALDRANTEFDDHGDTAMTRDYAYIAARKLELVDVKARTEKDRRGITEAANSGIVVRDAQLAKDQTVLASTQAQLVEERRNSTAATKDLQAANTKAAADLATEKQARNSAEGRLASAMKDLATISAVKEEARGLVITLSGSVLFASGKYALLETAKTKLDQVAEALKAQDEDKLIVVEGHTDSQGSDKTNQPLSLNRASAVHDYLVSKGVAAEKISAVGMGSTKPLTDNKTAENRANNRRVEIVISPRKMSAL